MNNKLILFFYLSISIFFLACKSQKNEYKEIEIAYFVPEIENDNLQISGYLHVDKNGFIKYFNDDSRYKTLESADISSPDSIIKIINQLFNSKQKLKEYEVSTKLEENQFFAGEYLYIRILYEGGEVDSLCTIHPFLNADFNTTYNSFQNFIYEPENRKAAPSFNIPSIFRTSLINAYKHCNYLPDIISVPPFNKEN